MSLGFETIIIKAKCVSNGRGQSRAVPQGGARTLAHLKPVWRKSAKKEVPRNAMIYLWVLFSVVPRGFINQNK